MTAWRPAAAALLPLLAVAVAVACAGDEAAEPPGAEDAGHEEAAAYPVDPPRNPFLADSAMPIGHGNSAQTDGVAVAGPTGPTANLTDDDLTYRHLGPGHFGLAISPEYPDGRRVIWSNGGDRISKLDHDTLDVLAELPLPGRSLLTAAEADSELALLDSQAGEELATTAVGMAGRYLAGLAGVYYVLDADNTLFVGGADSVIAYGDADAADPRSPIVVRAEWQRPREVPGAFVGVNMTFDGRLVLVTDEGWVVVVTRDFRDYVAAPLRGAEAAAAHNRAIVERGVRLGAGSWVRNSAAVDEDGGIYVASVEHMHKVVWDGETISTDPADGAWSEPYQNGTGLGTGATPTLMGFGDEDRFVVITDGDAVMDVVLYWRDDMPDDWAPLAGTPSRRIAGMLPADMGDPARDAIQTEQSVVVGGYGALVVNNEPASVPAGFPPAAARLLVSYAGADPAFTPHGVQKFEWDPHDRRFREAWVNTDVSSANAVPIVSTRSDVVYTGGARDGQWTVEGIDWQTGESRFHWITGSGRYNALFSGMNLDQEGRIVHTTPFGIVRYSPHD